jgi:hypothetical protein
MDVQLPDRPESTPVRRLAEFLDGSLRRVLVFRVLGHITSVKKTNTLQGYAIHDVGLLNGPYVSAAQMQS